MRRSGPLPTLRLAAARKGYCEPRRDQRKARRKIARQRRRSTDAEKYGTKASATKREIQVEIPVEDVNRQTDSLIQKYQKVARIPGFRRGHVPASIIRQRFSEEIKTDMVEALIPRFFRQEAERLSLHPVSQPRVTDLHLHDGEPLRFKAAFEVLPEIKLQGYKELRADKPEIAVSQADVEQALSDLRERHASFKHFSRGLKTREFGGIARDPDTKTDDDR